MELKRLAVLDIEVIPHEKLNFSKGVIRCYDLLHCTEQEIQEELESEGVIEAKKITKKENESETNTPSLSKRIKVAYLSIPVRTFVPSPVRCFKCQKLGHIAAKCNTEVEQCICGIPKHEGACDERKTVCTNCQGNHPANSKKCLKYLEQLAIQKLKTKEDITYTQSAKG